MKGTIVILGCLLAAYAAPLFANEVPLILEETIQLPVVPECWDVAKTSENEYTWVIGNAWYGTLYGDSNSTYYWGTTTLGLVDSFRARSVNNDGAGWPKYAEIYRAAGGSVQCIVMSSFNEQCNIMSNQVNVAQYDFSSDFIVGSMYQTSYCDRPPWYPGAICHCGYNVTSVAVAPSYPNTVQWFPTVNKWYDSDASGDRTPNRISTYIFGGETQSYIEANVIISAYSQWAFQPYFAVVDDGSDICTSGWIPEYCPIVRKYVIEGNSAILASSWPSIEQTPQECLELLCTWDEELQSALVILRSPDSLKAWTDQTDLTRWRYGITYGEVLLADAVSSLPGEELLVAEPQFELLHIRNPRDYSFWGQTSSFGAGYDEIKVISRYDGDYRRLVVRSGSELRIYRFGEPILDADDARPELPNELSISAYPNPFNPTTMIAFDLPKAGRARLVVYDLNGRLVQTLMDEQMSGGHHEFGFDGAALPSGIYFARLSAGELVKTHKMVLLK